MSNEHSLVGGYQDLANAIIMSAAADYWWAFAVHRKFTKREKYEKAEQEWENEAERERLFAKAFGLAPRSIPKPRDAIAAEMLRLADKRKADCENFFTGDLIKIYAQGLEADVVVQKIKHLRVKKYYEAETEGKYQTKKQGYGDKVMATLEKCVKSTQRSARNRNAKIAQKNAKKCEIIRFASICRFLAGEEIKNVPTWAYDGVQKKRRKKRKAKGI